MNFHKSQFITFILFIFVLSAFGVPTSYAEKPIKIGLLGPFKMIQGVEIDEVANMAAEEINTSGGILGRKVELIKAETEANPAKGKAAAERLLFRDNVDFIIGVHRSEVGLIVQPIIADAKKIFIATGTAVPKLSDNVKQDYARYKYFFRIFFGSDQMVKPMVNQVEDLTGTFGFKKIAIIAEDAVWVEMMVNGVKKAFGDNVVVLERPSTKAIDYSSEFAKVKSTGAEVIFTILSGNQTIPFVNQWNDMKVPALVTGMPILAQGDKFWDQTDGRAQSVMTWKHGVRAPITDKTIPYWDKFTKKYGHEPVSYTNFSTYDAMYILKKAVEKAGTLDPDTLVKTIEDTEFVGVSGVIKFDERHSPTVGADFVPFTYVQWQDGKQYMVWPDKMKVRDMIKPPWMK